MTLRKAVANSLRLLSARDRHKLLLVTGVQISTSFLDLVGVLLLGLVGALAVTTVQGLPPPPVVDDVVSSVGLGSLTSTELLAVLASLAAALLLTKSILSSYLLRRIFLFLAGKQALVSARLTKALLSRPLTFVQQRSSQQTSHALVQGASSATLLLLGQGVVLVSELSLLVILGAFLLVLDPLIALISIIFFALVAVALQLSLGRWALRAGQGVAESDVASLDAIQEAISSYRQITVSERRGLYIDRIQRLRWQAAKHAADLQFISTFPKYVFEVALVIGGFALAGVLFSTQSTVNAVGTLALFLAAATRVMPSLLRLQGASLMMRNAAGVAATTIELAEALDYPLDLLESVADPLSLKLRIRDGNPEFTPDIHLDDVTFTYPGASKPAISNVSLKAPAGSSVALVGASGAGKSTLADMILGVLEPEHGQVRIGSVAPVDAIRQWPGGIAYVPQDVALANATIRSNVAFGLPDAAVDDDMVWEALMRAHLVGSLLQDREGLDTLIGERGVMLSGGQRQRVGIARALYTRPRLLVLDEATSSLDGATEQAISRTIAELEGAVTTVIIAHRLSTVRHVDQLVYLEEGHAIARGTFNDVRSLSPAFNRQAEIMGFA
jgi:ATP-binding cassette, subfamily B, bacterial PglK